VLRLERRASHEGMVSVGGNLHNVPDTARRRAFDVHVLADEIRVFVTAVYASPVPSRTEGQPSLAGGCCFTIIPFGNCKGQAGRGDDGLP
jgi:hypothetical protein